MDKLKLAEQALVNEDIPNFRSGDRVNVHYRVREGEKERIQQFEGNVISRHGSGANKTFMVRKISAGNIGVERIFPLNSPFIAKIEVVKEGDVRRSKLYYLRERSGKSARIKEKDTRLFGVAATPALETAPENEPAMDEVTNDVKQSTPAEEATATAVASQEANASTEERPKKKKVVKKEEPKKEAAVNEEE